MRMMLCKRCDDPAPTMEHQQENTMEGGRNKILDKPSKVENCPQRQKLRTIPKDQKLRTVPKHHSNGKIPSAL